ncbi:hypothetical protein [Adhaeribacter aerolatus]|nr:hypothetical protein [Adhaeribacter aerolatus]
MNFKIDFVPPLYLAGLVYFVRRIKDADQPGLKVRETITKYLAVSMKYL